MQKKLSAHLKEKYGGSVRKVTFRVGLDCPNRDGTKGSGGCIFCSGEELVPKDYRKGQSVKEQICSGIRSAERSGKSRHAGFIAYFQDRTATHCDPELLRDVIEEASGVEGIVGISVGTRPDCLGAGIMDVLEETASRIPLWLEIGLQSSSDRTLALINRNHTAEDFRTAVKEAKARGISTVAHVVLGLPGEGMEDYLETARFIADTEVDGVKIHNLIVLKGTKLCEMYMAGEYVPIGLDEYCMAVRRFLELVPSNVVIHRLAAEAPASMIAAPGWAINKSAVLSAIEGADSETLHQD